MTKVVIYEDCQIADVSLVICDSSTSGSDMSFDLYLYL